MELESRNFTSKEPYAAGEPQVADPCTSGYMLSTLIKSMYPLVDKFILIKGNVCACVCDRYPDESIALTAMKFGTQYVNCDEDIMTSKLFVIDELIEDKLFGTDLRDDEEVISPFFKVAMDYIDDL
ncbi:hypothetical protein AVEN_55225-1 [Araneus ventricosus]|uniref:Uncharacterized protein n=1 Tax=Araneus ventricosus TaxID=182803 RepID=A0A4Y2TF20_ARAVE|nr:hypothetical protein AVEN_55225-1 [Araneus ventricosus]